MMDIIFQIIFTVIGAFLSVVLTKVLIQNGKILAEMKRAMEEGFRRMDERTEKIAELIKLEAERTRELIQTLRG